jgi:hypothetical protein
VTRSFIWINDRLTAMCADVANRARQLARTFGFSDPDGNTWAVQQLKASASKPLIPK